MSQVIVCAMSDKYQSEVSVLVTMVVVVVEVHTSMNGAAHAGEEFCFSCKLIQTARNDRIKYEKC